MHVLRLCAQALGKLLRDLPSKLRRGGLGVCNDQKIVQIRRRILRADLRQKPIDQNLGLSGARCRRNEQRAAPVINDRLL